MKKILSVCLLLAATASLRTEAFDWSGLVNVLSTAATQQAATKTEAQTKSVSEALTNVQKQAAEIDASMQNQFLSIVSLLSSKKDATSIKSEFKSINNDTTKTDAEKSELINQILNAYVSTLSSDKTNVISKIKKMSATQKVELIKEITSLEQYGQKYASLAKQAITTSATDFLSSTNSEDIATVVANTNKTASLIKEKATTTFNIVNQLRSLLTTAGVSK